MKTKKLASLFAVVSVLVIVAMSWMPAASAEEGTQTVDEGNSWAQRVKFFSGDYLTVSYTIAVQNAVYMDVMLLNEENYNKYLNGESFSYNAEGTDFNTVYTNVPTITFYEHDNYYIVVDNSDRPPIGAEPTGYCTFDYTITWKIHHPSGSGITDPDYYDNDDEALGPWGALCLIALIGFGLIVLGIFVGVLLHLKQKGQSPPQQQYQQPLQQPYYQDQQPPPPSDYRPPQ